MLELPVAETFSINGKTFEFSVAHTGEELMRGLKGVASLDSIDGMLFDFGTNFNPIMTPRGLLFPIEVAFITTEGRVVDVKILDPSSGLTQTPNRNDIRFALEVPVGFFEENNINIGDIVL